MTVDGITGWFGGWGCQWGDPWSADSTITIIPDLVVPARNREVIGVIAHESFTGSTHQDFPGRFRRSLHGYRVTLHFGDVATVTEVVVGCEFGGARFVVPSASWVSRVMSVHPI